ncbi:MAG: hypothetical protein ACR2HV_10425 [Acidimicrobiales bacterium]
MASPPVFLQRARRPASFTALLAVAGLMTIGFFVVPGVVFLTRKASDGTVPCQVQDVAPAALPPARPGAIFFESALSLTFQGPDGVRARSVDCKHPPDNHAPLRIAYRPSALGIEASGPGGTLACTVRPPVGEMTEAAVLRFVNDNGYQFDVAVVCPGGARPNRPMRVEYNPHDVGLRSFADAPGPFNTRGDDGPEPVAAAISFAIAAPLLAAVAWAWWKSRRIYVIAPLGAPPDEPAPSLGGPVGGAGASTTTDPTGPGSVFYAGLPGFMIALVGTVIAAATTSVNLVAGSAVAIAVAAAVIALTRRLLRPGRRDGMVITVSNEALTLAPPGGPADVVHRRDAGLVGVETHSGRNFYWVSGITVWRRDGHVLGIWSPAWPVGRSSWALRRALRRYGWPQVDQSPRWGGRLFHYDPGSAASSAPSR